MFISFSTLHLTETFSPCLAAFTSVNVTGKGEKETAGLKIILNRFIAAEAGSAFTAKFILVVTARSKELLVLR